MTIEVLMPAVGAGASEGKLIRWLKREGDPVVPGDLLAEIETDKAVMELEALDGGTLQALLVPEGAEGIAVGSAIAVLATADSDANAAAPATATAPADIPRPPAATAVTAPAAQAVAPTDQPRQPASPLARRLARQHGVSLDGIDGSGPHGRIVRIDIEQALQQRTAAATVTAATTTTAAPATPSGVPAQATTPPAPDAERLPHSAMRKTIARRLTESKQQVPHFYLDCDIRMEALLALREQLNAQGAHAEPAWRLSVNDMLVFAVAKALRRVPAVNASWHDDAVLRHRRVDICVAVATDGGLLTPIVREADRKGMAEIAADIRTLADKARSGKLAPDEYQGGGFTISNLGMYGIRRFSAIINPPQAAILAVGAVEQRPVVMGDAVVPGQVMSVTLSADHRVIDGAVGAHFLATLRGLLEAPLGLLA